MFPSLLCFLRRLCRTLSRSLMHLIYLHSAHEAFAWFLSILNG